MFALSATSPPIEVTIHACRPGTGECYIVGGAGPLAVESASVAFSWAHLNLARVMKRLLPHLDTGSLDGIVNAEADLQVSLADISMVKDGTSGGLAVVLAILDYFLGDYNIMARAGCSATGEIDLRGRVLPVADLVQKIEQAYCGGCSIIIAPFTQASAIVEDAKGGGALLASEELRQFVLTSLKPVETVIEAMEFAFTGEHVKPSNGLYCEQAVVSKLMDLCLGLLLKQGCQTRCLPSSVVLPRTSQSASHIIL